MTDPTITMAILSAAESALNALLARDPAVLKRLSRLDSKTLCISVSDLDITFYVLITTSGVRLLSVYEHECQASLRASSSALFNLIATQDVTRALHGSEFRIEGDTALIIELQQLALLYQFDLEALLAKLFGDLAGHSIHRGLRSIDSWVNNGQQILQHNIGEYLQEELQLLPSANEVAVFVDDLQHLALDLDRLEARINQLHERVATSHPEQQKD